MILYQNYDFYERRKKYFDSLPEEEFNEYYNYNIHTNKDNIEKCELDMMETEIKLEELELFIIKNKMYMTNKIKEKVDDEINDLIKILLNNEKIIRNSYDIIDICEFLLNNK